MCVKVQHSFKKTVKTRHVSNHAHFIYIKGIYMYINSSVMRHKYFLYNIDFAT